MKFEELFKDPSGELQLDKRKKVGGYVLGRTLGEGSFAKVRIATHVLSKEKVAVKVINKRLVNRREYVRKNMRREAVMLQRLCHPNIVRLYEVLETENSFYIVTELAEGGDLMKYLTNRGKLSEEESRRNLRQIVSAVDHMHRSGVIHRDLKIENLLLDKEMNIKIIDLGLSNQWDSHSLLSTQCGSPAYAAPEIFSKQQYGPGVDVWSIGVNLYAMVTGKLPFLVDPPTNLNKLHALILKGCDLPDHVSLGCQDLIVRMLEPKPNHRISLREVMLHPWLNEGYTQLALWPLKSRIPCDEVNLTILRYMTAKLEMGENTLKEAIMNHKPSNMVATYHLLCQRMASGLGLPSGGEESQGRSEELVQEMKDEQAGRAGVTCDGAEGAFTTGASGANGDKTSSCSSAAAELKSDYAVKTSDNYKECLMQLKNKHSQPKRGILKTPDTTMMYTKDKLDPIQCVRESNAQGEEVKSVSFNDKQLEVAKLTAEEVSKISDHYRMQSMGDERDIMMSCSPRVNIDTPESSYRTKVLLQQRRCISDQYSSPPAPPNSALGHHARMLPMPPPSPTRSQPTPTIHAKCVPKQYPGVILRNLPQTNLQDDQFYNNYRFKARGADGERALAWDLKPFTLPGTQASTRRPWDDRSPTPSRKISYVSDPRFSKLQVKDSVRLSRLGLSYRLRDHSPTLSRTRPRHPPLPTPPPGNPTPSNLPPAKLSGNMLSSKTTYSSRIPVV